MTQKVDCRDCGGSGDFCPVKDVCNNQGECYKPMIHPHNGDKLDYCMYLGYCSVCGGVGKMASKGGADEQ